MKLKSLAVFALAAMLSVPALAADEDAKKEKRGKKGAANRNPAAAFMKQLEPVGLTQEQSAKITEMGKAMAKASKEIRDEAKLTNDVMKKRTAAMKEVREAGKVKGRDAIAKAVNEKAGLSESQAAAIAKTSELRAKFQKDVMALLTDEQKAKLPKQMQRAAKGAAKGKGKKKKKDAA